MGFENLNWLIFMGVAGLSAVIGIVFIVLIWGMRVQEGAVAQNRTARRGSYMIAAAVGVKCCEVGFDLSFADRVRTCCVWGIPTMHLVDLTGFWSSFAILAMALMVVGRDRSNLGIEVRLACWTLLGISLAGGSLFLATELAK